MPTPALRRPSPAAAPRRPTAPLAATVRAVQIAYPQIYLACHTRHTRARMLLRSLPPADRRRAVDGLTLLGRAARALSAQGAR